MGNNNNILNLLISANLDPNSKKNIQEDLKSLKLEPIEIKVNSEAVDILKRFSEEMKKISNAVGITNDKLSKQVMIMKNVETGELEKRTRIFTDDGIVDKWSKLSDKQKEMYDNAKKIIDVKEKEKVIEQEVLNLEERATSLSKESVEAKREELKIVGNLVKMKTLYDSKGEVYGRTYSYSGDGKTTTVRRKASGELSNYTISEDIGLTVSQKQNLNYKEAESILKRLYNIKKQIIGLTSEDSNKMVELNKQATILHNKFNAINQRKIKISGGESISGLNEKQINDLDKLKKSLEDINKVALTTSKDDYLKNINNYMEKNKQFLTEEATGLLEQQKIQIQTTDITLSNQNKIQQEYDETIKKVKELVEEQKRLMSMGTNVSHTINTDTHGYLFNEENKANMQSYLESVYGVNTKIQGLQYGFDKTGKSVISFDRIIKNNNNTITKSKETVDIATGSIRNFGGRTEEVLNRNIGLWKAFTIAMARIPVWFAGMTVYVQAIRFLGNSVKYIADIDNAMNQIRIVTGISADEAERLGKAYNKLAKEMSVTTTEIATASVEFARQGLSQDEINERLIETIKYAKISNLEFVEASEIMTATVNSMKIDIERASDVFSYMGDATATGADEIGRAFQRVGKLIAA